MTCTVDKKRSCRVDEIWRSRAFHKIAGTCKSAGFVLPRLSCILMGGATADYWDLFMNHDTFIKKAKERIIIGQVHLSVCLLLLHETITDLAEILNRVYMFL